MCHAGGSAPRCPNEHGGNACKAAFCKVLTPSTQAKMVTTPGSRKARAPEQAEEPAAEEQVPSKAAEHKRGEPGGGEPATAEPAGKRQRRGGGGEEDEEAGEEAAEGAVAEAAAEASEPASASEEKEAAGEEEERKEDEQGGQPGEGGEAQAEGAEAGGGEGSGAAAAGGGEQEAGKEAGGILEQGRVTFLYRPKVGKEEVGSLDDVQRFFMLLHPSKAGVKSRLCVLGKKRLPSVRRHERFFGFVEATAESADELLEGLGPQQYKTKTRGTRHLAAARAVGQGTYALAEHKDHVKLLLEVPSTPGEAQLEFTIGEEGAFVLQVKNPEAHTEGDPGLSDRAEYSGEKQREFGDYRWISPRDTQLLDVPRCEFLLIGAREEMPAGLGEQLESEDEAACSKGAGSDDECMLEQLKQAVQSEKVGIDTEPAATGQLA
ncbi:hypothetical protein COHA_009293 [Chlorella ohadii]|uniref:Uncharacterized protein n=1 Tax=Chlorella ohadii TaxID=2649997 RepID=A0AAD5H1N0_9CHLO|nr:hypothetical protein COHA_009293 [Chlorella ohadii]